MKLLNAFIISLFVLSLVSPTQARKDPAGDYWKMVMKDQPMPQAVRDLITRPGGSDDRRFVKDFDISQSVIIYPAHVDAKDSMSSDAEDLILAHEDASSEKHKH